jgi:hypothetical protein
MLRRAKHGLLRSRFKNMTRLTLEKDPEAFAVRGWNTAADSGDYWIVFYNEITKVHVMPKRESFTIQVVTPDVEFEMDFANAQEARDALAQFEEKRVFVVDLRFQIQVASLRGILSVRKNRTGRTSLESILPFHALSAS